ncbi:MAG TPA: chemotaxis protein CheA [Gammaproteobacteria bacterium]|nr:chemotaxis protein CheA [Gammaproteobacteria bacterium]
MEIEADDEILQDFLVEAGEILEQLNEQLVELEQNPEDLDMLNAIFRGFHTIKGGAGFLALENMVAVCHRSEDVFNVLRQGDKILDATMMDHFLAVLDILNDQFSQVSEGEPLTPASPELLAELENMTTEGPGEQVDSTGEASEPEVPVVEETVADDQPAEVTAEGPQGDITDEEFDALLDTLAASGQSPQKGTAAEKTADSDKSASAAPDEITDEEFDNLLDQIHGEGKGPTVSEDNSKSANTEPAPENKAGSDKITDQEFETLLDEMHGEGKGPVKASVEPVAKPEQKKTPDTDSTSDVKKVTTHSEVKGKTAPAAKAPAKPAAETTVRVDTKRLDDIMNMVGELVLVRNRLHTLKEAVNDEQITKAVSNLDIVTSDLQSAVMKTRMQPIKKVFGRFPRVVRDLARSLKKEVNLELVGEETDLDKNLVEALADPLVHLVRNSVDHGIEMPDAREKSGKPRIGKVVLSAAQEGDHILLRITDDGAGMDPELLRSKAVEKGVMDTESAARLDDKECYELIFHPGFSTKTEISDVSGRGVGMDVVKTRIAQLNGHIEISSQQGKGTSLSIQLPLTLAILPTLMVKVGSRNFALPLSSVNEIFHLEDFKTNMVDGQLTVMVREKAMPLFYMEKWLVTAMDDQVPDENKEEQVVVTHLGSQRIGFVVTQVLGQEEVVIKPLGHLLHGLAGFAGATITGDGRIALILDVPGLMRSHL